MKKSFRFTAAILTAALLVTLFGGALPVFASQDTTDSTVIEDSYEAEIQNASNSAAVLSFDKGSLTSLYVGFSSSADRGSYERTTVNGVNCHQLLYSAYDGLSAYRMMPKFKNSSTSTANHRYARITYMTTDTVGSKITFANNATGFKVTIVPDSSVSGGQFVTSDVIDIYEPDKVVGTTTQPGLPARIASGNHFLVEYQSEATDAVIYIKEIAFFTSKQDAYEYYSDAVIMDFTSADTLAENAKMLAHADNGYDSETDTYSTFDYTTVNGTGCMKLNYSEKAGWPSYRFMPQFSKSGTVTTDHTYIRVTYMTDEIIPFAFRMRNNGQGTFIKLVPNTRVSNGEFVRSNAISIYQDSYVDASEVERIGAQERFANGSHCTFEFMSDLTTSNFYIKEIAFFKSEDVAYAYYGDAETEVDVEYSVMDFSHGGTAGANQGVNWGNNFMNIDDGTLDIVYAETTNFGQKYMAKVRFNSGYTVADGHTYMRILYGADMPDSVASCLMTLTADAGGGTNYFENIVDTNGAFVLTETQQINENQHSRFKNGNHCSLMFNTTNADCVFKIRAIYFFGSEEDANNFEYSEGEHTINVGGVDISNYKIVVGADAPEQNRDAALLLRSRIKYLTGNFIDIVTDSEPVSTYEILIGKSNRAQSYDSLTDEGLDETADYQAYLISVKNKKIILTSFLPAHTKDCVNIFLQAFLYDGLTVIPETLTINDGYHYVGTSNVLKLYTNWTEVTNVASPEVFYEDFNCDDGYFGEDAGADNFVIANGVMTVTADDHVTTNLHVYEQNAIIAADLDFEAAGDNGDMGVMLRQNSDDAWVKAGYDFAKSEWYIDSRDGQDFYIIRCASKALAVNEDKVYRVELTCDGDAATLKVDGATVLTTDKLTHFSTGRAGVFAEDVTLTVDNVEFTMLSGQGTVWKNVDHTKLPTNDYTEGGTVLERADGETITFLHHYGHFYNSTDNGKTWTETDAWFDTYGYTNAIRLNNGNLLQIYTRNGYKAARTSTDDGKTWTHTGDICLTPYNGDTNYNASAGNMNDKIFQVAADSKYNANRLFYCQNYEARVKLEEYNNRMVFCEFFYSDDNGATWIKSDTTSWELEGNEDQTHFGECKILQCDDGTIRMYNSWNRHGNIVYSDSTDGGKTFGPLVHMTDFKCSTSSMQFVRDIYADNPHTYYMIWVNSYDHPITTGMPRCSLVLAYSEDGKNWDVLGEIWRWESTYYNSALVNHVVDPFIQVTPDYIICGSGFSDGLPSLGDVGLPYHNGQREHIYSIPKISFVKEENYSKIFESDEYLTLSPTTKLVMIEAEDNTATYSYNGKVFKWSPKYKAHVAIVDSSVTKAQIYSGISVTQTAASELVYNGDVNGDGRITAADAAIVSLMLHNPDSDFITDEMRFAADAFGAHNADESGQFPFVSVLDAFALLRHSVGYPLN